MAKQTDPQREASNTQPSVLVDAFAATVLKRVADGMAHRHPNLISDYFDQLKTAALTGPPTGCIDLIDVMLADGISAEDIADFYVPAVARSLGADWETDDLAFVEVTIGTSRLLGMLRALGPEWRADAKQPEHGGAAALVLLAPEVYHTLGATVLAGQLRRSGLTVRLVLGGDREELAMVLEHTNYDVAMVSASIGESLESIRKLIGLVRSLSHNSPPIVLGGTILDQNMDVGAVTGADYATSNLIDALRFCGLQMARPALQKHENG